MDWSIKLSAHYPHDRFALGWEYIAPSKDYEYSTITIYLLFITINIDYETHQ
jgi:hypothetical protein